MDCDAVEGISCDGDLTLVPQKQSKSFLEGDENNVDGYGSCSDRAKKSRPKVVKTEDDATPLTDPFPLPSVSYLLTKLGAH